jgi:prepilin-type N-terminal cleavage/methylation domain-containing protein
VILAVRPPTLTDVLLHMPVLPSTTAARCTPAPGCAARSGFSLVELLVVIGIIATMTGLVLGGLFRSRDGNRLLAAEQVLADAIRQARHTARSTGSPVELRLTPLLNGSEVTGAKLAGVSRTVLWSETFDKVRDLDDDGVIDAGDEAAVPAVTTGADGVVIGRSGNGRVASPLHPIVHQLTRSSRLVRADRTEGFHLSCSVLPPTAITHNAILPLVVVGDAGAMVAESQCVLYLRGYVPPPNEGQVPVWELVGAVWSESGAEVTISSHAHQITTRMVNPTLPSGAPDLAHAIVGGRWIDVGLLYDGLRLLLYRNSQRIAELRTGVPRALRAEGDFVHVGMIHLLNQVDPTYAPAPLDDVRLYRLGTAGDSTLPGNVVLVDALRGPPKATLGWRMLCQPDGRVEVSRDDDSDATPVNDRVTTVTTGTRTGDKATILLGQLRSPGTIQNAELTVTLDGRVSSRLVAEQSGAPVE